MIALAREKRRKRALYDAMLQTIGSSTVRAEWIGSNDHAQLSLDVSDAERAHILARAGAMLHDSTYFFTFDYRTEGIPRPWNYDPIEKRWWPERHYTEQALHAADTPKDVKIVWEINRFSDLPTLGQAALLDFGNRADYTAEALRRIHSWIEDNPVARTVNWASALEIGLRLISWSTTIELLRRAEHRTVIDEALARSIVQQATYLAADLSTDKVVRSNHLIGEAAGLFIAASWWDYASAAEQRANAKAILEKEIIDQTFPDGATREATTWYHQFVTDLFDLSDRVATRAGDPMSAKFQQRLSLMKRFLKAMEGPTRELTRIGDADDGWALFFTGNRARWIDRVFGGTELPSVHGSMLFPDSGFVRIERGTSLLVTRAGAFGMGGDGSSSHAHDDLLSPVLWLNGLPVLVDPGTFVYNGDPVERSRYRGADAHNTLVIGAATGAVQKLNFGWKKTRPHAQVLSFEPGAVTMAFGEWKGEHARRIELAEKTCRISDDFVRQLPDVGGGTWYLHLHPDWQLLAIDELHAEFALRNIGDGGTTLAVTLTGGFLKVEVDEYPFSDSYLVQRTGWRLRARAEILEGSFATVLSLHEGNKPAALGVRPDSSKATQ